MAIGIERNMTATEKAQLSEEGTPGVDLGSRKKSWQDQFTIELNKQAKKIGNNGPFARHVAKEDYYNLVELWEKEWKRIGYATKPRPTAKDLTWAKYSDIKNFELLETKQRNDSELTKNNPGLNVNIETKVYVFKGYPNNKYTIMEDGAVAIQRAITNRAKLDKQISGSI